MTFFIIVVLSILLYNLVEMRYNAERIQRGQEIELEKIKRGK